MVKWGHEEVGLFSEVFGLVVGGDGVGGGVSGGRWGDFK